MENKEEMSFDEQLQKVRKDIEKLPQYKRLTPQQQKEVKDIGEAYFRKMVDPNILTKEQTAILDSFLKIMFPAN